MVDGIVYAIVHGIVHGTVHDGLQGIRTKPFSVGRS